MKRRSWWFVVLFAAACGTSAGTEGADGGAAGRGGATADGGRRSDGAAGARAPDGPRLTPDGDCDADGVDNATEERLGTMPCEKDSDGDGIEDGPEVNSPGACIAMAPAVQTYPAPACSPTAPCPAGSECRKLDPLNPDQDGDGVRDGEEDRNHDGMIDPMDGETDPRLGDSDGDGVPDAMEGSATVCSTPALVMPTLQEDMGGDYTLALDPAFAGYRLATVTGAAPVPVAAVWEDAAAGVAGFVLSRRPDPGVSTALDQDSSDEARTAALPMMTVTSILNRQPFRSSDAFSGVTSLRRVTLPAMSDAGQVRDAMLRELTARPGEVTVPAGGSFPGGDDYVLSLATLYRAPDRIVVVGAIAPFASYNDRATPVGIRVRDLTNGTALAKAGDVLAAECDAFRVNSLPIADFVWMVDTSGSVGNDQMRIAGVATQFMDRLGQSGVDFRVGVRRAGCDLAMGAQNLVGGNFTRDAMTFATRIGTEVSTVPPAGCQAETPIESGLHYQEFMLTQPPELDVAPNDLDLGLRAMAKSIFIFVTDEDEDRLKAMWTLNGDLAPVAANAEVQRYAAFYAMHEILAFGMLTPPPVNRMRPMPCTNGESSLASRVLVQATGGAEWSICAEDPVTTGAAIDAMIAAAQGAASTYILQRVPISSTLKVSLGGRIVPRSALDGFDYNASANAIVFNIVPGSMFQPRVGDELVVSYRYFVMGNGPIGREGPRPAALRPPWR
jgi:hypothetical protein